MGPAEALFDNPANLAPGDGRALVKAAAKLLGNASGEDGGGGGDSLAELDVGGAEALAGAAEGGGDGGLGTAAEAALVGIGGQLDGERAGDECGAASDGGPGRPGKLDALRLVVNGWRGLGGGHPSTFAGSGDSCTERTGI